MQAPPGKKQRTGLYSDDNKRWLKAKAGRGANGAPQAAVVKRKAKLAPQQAEEAALVEEDSDSGMPPWVKAWPPLGLNIKSRRLLCALIAKSAGLQPDGSRGYAQLSLCEYGIVLHCLLLATGAGLGEPASLKADCGASRS